MSTEGTEQTRRSPGLSSVRRKAVDFTKLVETQELDTGPLPLLIRPAEASVDLAEWVGNNPDEVDEYLNRHGAILFRGFGLDGVEAFERIAAAIAPDLFAEYGDLPPEPTSQRVYGSTPYPADKTILFHNESSHLPQWPMRQFFFCVIPAKGGGETPLLDCRRVYNELKPEIRDKFEQKGLMYVRNFSPGIDVSWQEFFKTDDRAEVERTCAEAGMDCEWTGSDGLRIRQLSPAVISHPKTGERVFFNQVQLHHVSCLDPETRDSLRQLFSEEEMPRNVYFGDGSMIPDEVMNRLGTLYDELAVELPWEAGDLIVVDNMLVAHARRPFAGPRKILVAMARMVALNEGEIEAVPA